MLQNFPLKFFLLLPMTIMESRLHMRMGVVVLSPKGILYEEDSIQTALDLRNISAKARRKGVYGKGAKPFQAEDRQRFSQCLTKILSNFAGI